MWMFTQSPGASSIRFVRFRKAFPVLFTEIPRAVRCRRENGHVQVLVLHSAKYTLFAAVLRFSRKGETIMCWDRLQVRADVGAAILRESSSTTSRLEQ